jgi:hypothetical protein
MHDEFQHLFSPTFIQSQDSPRWNSVVTGTAPNGPNLNGNVFTYDSVSAQLMHQPYTHTPPPAFVHTDAIDAILLAEGLFDRELAEMDIFYTNPWHDKANWRLEGF